MNNKWLHLSNRLWRSNHDNIVYHLVFFFFLIVRYHRITFHPSGCQWQSQENWSLIHQPLVWVLTPPSLDASTLEAKGRERPKLWNHLTNSFSCDFASDLSFLNPLASIKHVCIQPKKSILSTLRLEPFCVDGSVQAWLNWKHNHGCF